MGELKIQIPDESEKKKDKPQYHESDGAFLQLK
jgi:hypothetical protein